MLARRADEVVDLFVLAMTTKDEEEARGAVRGLVQSAPVCLHAVLGACDRAAVWREGVVGLVEDTGSNVGTNSINPATTLTSLIVSQGTIARFTALFDADCPTALRSAGVAVLDQLAPALQLRVLPVVDDMEVLARFESVMIEGVVAGEIVAFRVVAKYVLLHQALGVKFVKNLVHAVSSLLSSSSPGIRFVGIQLLALLPEAVPVGKLVGEKSLLLSTLRALLGKEPKLVVRKQMALCLTNWLNVV